MPSRRRLFSRQFLASFRASFSRLLPASSPTVSPKMTLLSSRPDTQVRVALFIRAIFAPTSPSPALTMTESRWPDGSARHVLLSLRAHTSCGGGGNREGDPYQCVPNAPNHVFNAQNMVRSRMVHHVRRLYAHSGVVLRCVT